MLVTLMLAKISPQGALLLQPGDAVIFHLDKGHPVIDHMAHAEENPSAGALRAGVTINETGGTLSTLLTIVNNTSGLPELQSVVDAERRDAGHQCLHRDVARAIRLRELALPRRCDCDRQFC